MAQPLTDAINALTTYANTVTGKTPPDTTLSDAVSTLASGYGQGGGIINMTGVRASTTIWQTPVCDNTLSNGGSLEIVFSDPNPATDYGNIIDFGRYSDLSNYNNAYVMHIYHQYTESLKMFVIRQGTTSTYHEYDTTLTQHTIKIDKDYVYIDSQPVIATASNIVNTANVAIGSQEGNKRFQGTYQSITYK